jgi:hypothetical protein
MPTPTRLDLYLAGAIARRDDQHERLRAMGVDPAAARAARNSMDAGSLRHTEGGALEPLILAFGKPALRRVERVAWSLALWPEHRYECQLREWGVGAGEFVRALPDGGPVVGATPATLLEAIAAFQPWRHTRRDIERALGDPVFDLGAFPDERCDWRLGHGGVAMFEFTHGLLMRVSAASPRPDPRAGRRPWAFWRR